LTVSPFFEPISLWTLALQLLNAFGIRALFVLAGLMFTSLLKNLFSYGFLRRVHTNWVVIFVAACDACNFRGLDFTIFATLGLALNSIAGKLKKLNCVLLPEIGLLRQRVHRRFA
jgi:hypothetical protein